MSKAGLSLPKYRYEGVTCQRYLIQDSQHSVAFCKKMHLCHDSVGNVFTCHQCGITFSVPREIIPISTIDVLKVKGIRIEQKRKVDKIRSKKRAPQKDIGNKRPINNITKVQSTIRSPQKGIENKGSINDITRVQSTIRFPQKDIENKGTINDVTRAQTIIKSPQIDMENKGSINDIMIVQTIIKSTKRLDLDKMGIRHH